MVSAPDAVKPGRYVDVSSVRQKGLRDGHVSTYTRLVQRCESRVVSGVYVDVSRLATPQGYFLFGKAKERIAYSCCYIDICCDVSDQ